MNSTVEFNKISELDLDPIKVKLMHKESGEAWSRLQVDAVEFEYRRFLHLLKLFPEEQVAPRFDVDIFWHYHILDTMKYAADCEQMFGYFLHHFPYSGLGGEEDEADHHRTGTRTQELYEATFGEAYIRSEEGHAVSASSPEVKVETAWCQGVTSTSAWCQGVAAKTAWCQGAAAKTAWCQAIMATKTWPHAVAQNDSFYSPPVLAKAA